METDPHTQPLPLSPILDFSTDDFSGGLVAKDPSSARPPWPPPAGSAHPSKPNRPLWRGSAWGAREGPTELRGEGWGEGRVKPDLKCTGLQRP